MKIQIDRREAGNGAAVLTEERAPGYRDVYERLQQDIRMRKLQPGSALPSVRTLCRQYEASMMTVRRALDMLASERTIVKQQGRGNFVRTVRKTKIALLIPERYYREPLTVRLVRRLNDQARGFEIAPAFLSDINTATVRRFQSEQNMPCLVLARFGFETMAQHDVLMPLDECSGFAALRQDLPGHLDYRHNGGDGLARHYWLPLFLHPACFAMNLDLARACGLPDDRGPEDWAELLDWAAAFQRWAGPRPDGPKATYGRNYQIVTPHLSYLAAGGGDSRFSADCSELSRANVEDFIALFARLAADGAMVFPPVPTNAGHEMFIEGTYLFHASAMPWFAYEAELYNPAMACEFFRIPPKLRGGRRISYCASVRLGMARPLREPGSDAGEACWEALRGICLDEQLPEWGRELKSMPARLSCRDAAIAANPRLKGFYDGLADAQFGPATEAGARRRFAADTLLTPFFVNRRMLNEPAQLARLLRDMIANTNWGQTE